MVQTYDMIFWARAHELDIDEMTEISYRVLKELEGYGGELAPKYLPSRRKKDAKEFELEKGNIKQLLEKNVDEIFPDHGTSIGFFSSMNNNLASGVSIGIGNSSPLFPNTATIGLPMEKFSGLDCRRDDLEDLFKKIISIFNPYFAFISNSLNHRQLSMEGFWKRNKPTYVHWMNYYDKATVEAIGIRKLSKLEQCEQLGEGYFLKLQDAPTNVDNPGHLELQRKVSRQLGLL